jgi:hypothetical protein
MIPTAAHAPFLASVDALNNRFAGIRYRDQWKPLVHPFWRVNDIMEGLALRTDWGIDTGLVPFFGDWHDVICLDLKTAAVVYLDDDRNVVHHWATKEDFLSSLTADSPPEPTNGPKVIKATYSPKFNRAAKAFAEKLRKKGG